MALRDLVRFAQTEIALRAEIEVLEVRGRVPSQPQMPEESDLAANQAAIEDAHLIAERPPLPAWMRDEASELIPVHGPRSFVFTEAELGNRVDPNTDVGSSFGPDALAYYLPYHFYCNGIWG